MSSRTLALTAATAVACVVGLSSVAHAHFRLLEPASSTVQTTAGNPQKDPPCGPMGTGGTKTGAITKLKAGQKLTVKISEETPHPGHYRVSLGLTSTDVFKDPPVKTMGNLSVSTEIQNPPVMPVIGDGLWVHTEAQARAQKMQSFDVTIPADVSCAKCTIQVIQFMAEHPPGYFYYHCADVSIEAASGGGADGGASDASTGGADAGTAQDAAAIKADSGAAGSGGAGGSGGSSGGGAGGTSGTGGKAGTGGGAAGSGAGGQGGDDETGGNGGTGAPRKASGGCAVGGASAGGGWMILLAIAVMFRRRRQRS